MKLDIKKLYSIDKKLAITVANALGYKIVSRKKIKISTKDPATMTPSVLNKELEVLDKLGSKLNDEFIDQGRGHEKWSEILKKDDPLAKDAIAVQNRKQELRNEIELRCGPGFYTMPPGFKPRKK